MKYKLIFLIGFFGTLCNILSAQSISEILAEKQKRPIQVGDSAPDFILTVGENSIRSFTLRKLKRITLLHFWNTQGANQKIEKGHLLRLLEHYEKASFKNANGFEIIAIAVEKNIEIWKQATTLDSLNRLTHGMARDSLDDQVCKDYNISTLPSDILVDENGFIIDINPSMLKIENLLDERKNYQSIKNDVSGIMALSSDKSKVLKGFKLSLFNYYGDAIAETFTNEKGEFVIHDLKLNQDFSIQVENKGNDFTSKPIALYTKEGDFVIDGKVSPEGCIFTVPTRVANRLIVADNLGEGKHLVEEIDVIKSLTFSDNGTRLTSKDEKELNIIVFDMKKDSRLIMDFYVHTDSKVDEIKAMEITSNQVGAIKDYFLKKGLDLCHITGVAKGNSEMRKLCIGNGDCSEEDHKLNRRVEFWLYIDKELTE